MAKSQKSSFLPIKYQPSGGLSSDLSPLAPQAGTYSDAKNIHFLTQLGQTTIAIENCLGNSFAFELPTVATQNEIFKIYFSGNPTLVDVYLEFFDGNGVSLGVVHYQQQIGGLFTYANLVASLQTVLGIGNISVSPFVFGQDWLTLEFTGGTSVPFWNYSVVQTTTGTTTPPITIQEAIDTSLAGMLRFIGSYDVGGDGLIWSTPQTEMPSDIAITNISNNGGFIQLTIADTTLTPAGALIKITNSNASNNANGQWIVKSVDSATQITIYAPFASSTAPYGVVTININGVGEIGVAVQDISSSTWNYITLIRSREFNFRVQRQPKIVCERNDIQLNCYWTDNYNPYRRFYYQGAYIANGGLNFVDPLNIYFYGEIYNKTRLFQGNGLAGIEFSAQLQSGGSLFAGNYRYMVRFLDEDFNPTLWTDPSGIFVVSLNPLIPNTETVAEQVYGNDSITQTSKINQILLKGIVPNLFKYVELGVLFYVDNTPVPVATIASRTLLAQTPTQIIQHTGNETDVRTLDINTLLQTQPDILTGLGIDIVSNRLLPSNTTSHAAINYQSWIDTFKYNLLMDSIEGILSREDGDLKVGEYEIPYNTFNKMGFMLNETYRISAKLELLNGAFTDNFFLSDITFNTSNTSSDGKRTSGLPFMDLTDISAQTVYVPIVNITNIDWDFKVNGVAIKNQVKRIHWEMVEMTEQFQEVLGSGAVAMGYSCPVDGSGDFSLTFESDHNCTKNLFTAFEASPNFSVKDITDYLFIEGAYIRIGQDEYTYDSTFFIGNGQERKYMSFYTPDVLFNQKAIFWQNGDQLICFGQPNVVESRFVDHISPGQNALVIFSANKEFSGYVDSTMYPNVTYPLDVDGVQNIQSGALAGFPSLTGGRQYSKKNPLRAGYVHPFTAGFYMDSLNEPPSSPVLNTTGDVVKGTNFLDYGFYIAQYFRPKSNKFGDKANNKYIPTGAITEYLSVDALMYGDTFNQKTWLKHRIIPSLDNTAGLRNTCTSDLFAAEGFGGGIGFYSQNRVNSQMIRRSNTPYAQWQYPAISAENWLDVMELYSNPNYNSGYNSQQGVTSDIAFDPNLPRAATTPARFWWSLNKPENSIQDLYTVILPLNFKDEDLTNGDIWHTLVANSNFFTFQRKNFVRQYIEDTALMTNSESEVVTGSSGVASQRGNQLSGYGTTHGFGVIKGKSAGGKDTIYWIDTYQCKVMRFEPSDGTKCLSDAHNMRWFFNNYLQFTNLDTAMYPAAGSGICGVWDDQNSEAIWTVRAHKSVDEWMYGANYEKNDEVFWKPLNYLTYNLLTGLISVGDRIRNADTGAITSPIVSINGNVASFVTGGGFIAGHSLDILDVSGNNIGDAIVVSFTPAAYLTFEQTGEIYIALTDNIDSQPDLNPSDWLAVPHFGRDVLPNGQHPYEYWNEYSIAYNEVKDKFTTRYSPLAMLYIKIGKQFLIPRPVEFFNRAYVAYDKNSELCVWFKALDAIASDIEQADGWFIEGMIINYDVDLDKRALAVEFLTEIAPERVDITNKKYSTFMLQNEFQARGDYYITSVKNNEVNGVVSGDSSRIFGSFFSLKLSGVSRVYQNLYNFILKCVVKNRTWKS